MGLRGIGGAGGGGGGGGVGWEVDHCCARARSVPTFVPLPLPSRLPPSLPSCPALRLADVPDSAELTLTRLAGVTDR